MRNTSWMIGQSRRNVRVRRAEDTAGLISVIFYNHMMEEIREAIEEGRYQEYKRQKLSGMEAGA